MALFESYERRIDQINAVLNSYGIASIEEAENTRTLKSLFQHHSSKASILWHSAFFIVQPLHPYMTTGKTIALTRRNFVSK